MLSQATGLVAEPAEEITVGAWKSNIFGNMQVWFNLFGHYEGV